MTFPSSSSPFANIYIYIYIVNECYYVRMWKDYGKTWQSFVIMWHDVECTSIIFWRHAISYWLWFWSPSGAVDSSEIWEITTCDQIPNNFEKSFEQDFLNHITTFVHRRLRWAKNLKLFWIISMKCLLEKLGRKQNCKSTKCQKGNMIIRKKSVISVCVWLL